MPNLATHQSSTSTKALLIGDSGTGKTGALWSLAKAGYTLNILDFDNGLDILIGIARKEKREDVLKNINFKTITDPMHQVNGKILPKAAIAWPTAMKLLDNWDDGEVKLGKLSSWDANTILVLDSLTFAGRAAMRFVLQLNSRLASGPWQSDYNIAQQQLEAFLALAYSESTKCNVLILSHVRQQGNKVTTTDADNKVFSYEEDGTRKGFPETGTGRALSPIVGRYFNAVLLADIEGTGLSAKRIIRTVPHDNIGLKNPAPGIVKATYPIETGLADYFTAVRGEAPKG